MYKIYVFISYYSLSINSSNIECDNENNVYSSQSGLRDLNQIHILILELMMRKHGKQVNIVV